MLVTDIIKKVRAKAQDNNEINYSDYDILLLINNANKIYREVCRTEAPGFLVSRYEGVLGEGENEIHFSAPPATDEDNQSYINCKPVRIISIKCNGRVMHNTSPYELDDMPSNGRPEKYMLMNDNGVLLLEVYPVPSEEVNVEIMAISESAELTTTSDMPVPSDFANYIVDFVAGGLAGASDVGAFKDGIKNALREFLPSSCVVDSYY